MPIKRSTEPITVENIVFLLCALHGQGKTTLGFSAGENPMVLDFDKGTHRAANVSNGDRWEVDNWREIENINPADIQGNDVIVVDTVGRALEFLSAKLVSDDYKNSTANGGLSLQGYGALKQGFLRWTQMLRRLKRDIVLIAHLDETLTNGEMYERIDMAGSSKNEVYKSADVIGKIVVRNNEPTLAFDPTETSIGKNPGRLPSVNIPDIATEPQFLKGVMQNFKNAMNIQSSQREGEIQRVSELRQQFASITDVNGFNAHVQHQMANNVSEVDKKILADAAVARGYVWDNQIGGFIDPPPQPQVGQVGQQGFDT